MSEWASSTRLRTTLTKRLGCLFVAVPALVLCLSWNLAAQDFHGCPPEGTGADPALNHLKNRTAQPEPLEPMRFHGLRDLLGARRANLNVEILQVLCELAACPEVTLFSVASEG